MKSKKSTGPGQSQKPLLSDLTARLSREKRVTGMVNDSIEVTPDLLAPIEIVIGPHFLTSTRPWKFGLLLRNREDGRLYWVAIEEVPKRKA